MTALTSGLYFFLNFLLEKYGVQYCYHVTPVKLNYVANKTFNFFFNCDEQISKLVHTVDSNDKSTSEWGTKTVHVTAIFFLIVFFLQ